MSKCPDTTDGQHDWLTFERPACTHNGDNHTTTTAAAQGRVCNWCGETDYRERVDAS